MAETASGSAKKGTALTDVWQTFAVPIVFTGFVVVRAADRVFAKRFTNALLDPSYNLILWNLIWPFAIQVVTLAYMIPYIFILRRSGHEQYDWRFILPGNPAASTMGAVPLIHLGLFALGDQIQVGMQGPPAAYLSQTMLSVMTNTTIVWVAVLSALFLGTRYKQVHYIGGILVIISILVALSTKLSSNDCSAGGMSQGHCLTAYKGNNGAYHQLSGRDTLVWFGIYMVSVIPGAVSDVYKQYVLQGRDVDVIYATWWSGNFQVLWGWLCLPLLWIKLPGQDLSPGQTLQALANTWSCLNGNIPHPGNESCATSPTPLFWFAVYLVFNLSFNVLMLWLTKHLSATWATVATVLCLDLTNIFGMIPFLAGGGAETMTLNDWLATVLASVALWVYNMAPEVRKVSTPQEATAGASEDMEQDDVSQVSEEA